MLTFILVGARLATRRQWPAVAIALVVWSVSGLRLLSNDAKIGLEFGFILVAAAIMIAVLLRYGMLRERWRSRGEIGLCVS